MRCGFEGESDTSWLLFILIYIIPHVSFTMMSFHSFYVISPNLEVYILFQYCSISIEAKGQQMAGYISIYVNLPLLRSQYSKRLENK